MNMSRHRCWSLALLTSLIVVAPGAPLSAQDWAQWRGPDRDGVVPSFQAPGTWPDRLKPGWKVTVGIGHSSPVVVGDTVFVHARQDEREVVSAFNLMTGKILWQDSYDAPYSLNPAATSHGKGPKSTPVAANGRLYTLGITEILSCYDIAAGKMVWRKDFSGQFKRTSPDFGTAMSPIVDRGLLIVHVGTSGQGALAALDAVTGEVKWRWTGDGPGYVSPIVATLGGTRQIVTQSQSTIVSVAADTGKMLWTLPFTTPYVQNIVTPLVYKDTLIFSGLEKGVMAIRPAKRGEEWTTEQVWQNADVSMYMNSPVLSGSLLLGFSHKNRGQYFCLDAATGKTLWKGEGRQGENAAMVIAGNLVFSLSTDGDLFVTKASATAGLEPIKTYRMAESPTWAHPILVGRRVLIKDATTLALWTIE
jgi:outer membrane protein assembly factor BamB